MRPLTRRRLAALLQRHGHDPAPLRAALHPQAGRNRLFTLDGPGVAWIAKQASVVPGREVWFYAGPGRGFAAAPACVVADPADDTVVLARPDGAETLHVLAQRAPREALAAYPRFAAALAELHAGSGFGPGAPAAPSPLVELDPVDLRLWVRCSPAAQGWIARVQRSAALPRALARACSGEGPAGLVHGDLKADNVLCHEGRCLLIDWELCGAGPLGWDLGAVTGSMTVLWSDRLKLDRDRPPADWVAGGEVPFRELYAAVREFFTTYNARAGQLGLAVPDRLEVAVHAAAWMVVRTWSEAMLARELTAPQLMRLSVAESLLRDPFELFGDLRW